MSTGSPMVMTRTCEDLEVGILDVEIRIKVLGECQDL